VLDCLLVALLLFQGIAVMIMDEEARNIHFVLCFRLFVIDVSSFTDVVSEFWASGCFG